MASVDLTPYGVHAAFWGVFGLDQSLTAAHVPFALERLHNRARVRRRRHTDLRHSAGGAQ